MAMVDLEMKRVVERRKIERPYNIIKRYDRQETEKGRKLGGIKCFERMIEQSQQ